MENNNEFLDGFMKKLEFPEEAQLFLAQVAESLEQDEENFNEMNVIIKQFLDKQYEKFDDILERLNFLAQKTNIHQYTIHLISLMYCSKILKDRYNKAGISEGIYWNTMLDLRCKLLECKDVHGIWGTFVASWFPGFYSMERFGLGRFQYEWYDWDRENYTRNGYTVHKGDRVYNMHIPSAGAITREIRMDSYKKAYKFFKHELNGKPIVLVCESWLLYPDNEKILPEGSNTVEFMHDFDIIERKVNEAFTDAWRIFGKDYNKTVDELPTKTSMQRAFAGWLKAGNKTGSGFGIILFDGENIR